MLVVDHSAIETQWHFKPVKNLQLHWKEISR